MSSQQHVADSLRGIAAEVIKYDVSMPRLAALLQWRTGALLCEEPAGVRMLCNCMIENFANRNVAPHDVAHLLLHIADELSVRHPEPKDRA